MKRVSRIKHKQINNRIRTAGFVAFILASCLLECTSKVNASNRATLLLRCLAFVVCACLFNIFLVWTQKVRVQWVRGGDGEERGFAPFNMYGR